MSAAPPLPLAELVRQFRALTLPKDLWTHEAHLRAGLWHVLEFGEDRALAEMRRAIRAYNEATGGVNSEDAGYHETITRFYVWRIARFVEATGAGRAADELADALVASCGDRALPLRHWSRERLMSRAARLGWLEPDLAPLA